MTGGNCRPLSPNADSRTQQRLQLKKQKLVSDDWHTVEKKNNRRKVQPIQGVSVYGAMVRRVTVV